MISHADEPDSVSSPMSWVAGGGERRVERLRFQRHLPTNGTWVSACSPPLFASPSVWACRRAETRGSPHRRRDLPHGWAVEPGKARGIRIW
ncbi:hypothetical protein TH66_01070 [Carbonactinospora thermoautotrophica]|uniref:Uncharacterized protein n=1 Tax=Carbonactinospora thermoautotrophica TaxID=1469144 RepID=A0A132NDF4_9ACTN|nr:hypothetical protein TH66_01070 [Carbonactinospora thermoautotrophica]KWX08133.1 hypothetical protein TR74_16340 [Carbonactinospora thermoautotrophica]